MALNGDCTGDCCGKQNSHPHPHPNMLGHMAKGIKVADTMRVTNQLTLRLKKSSLDYPGRPYVMTRVLKMGESGWETWGLTQVQMTKGGTDSARSCWL